MTREDIIRMARESGPCDEFMVDCAFGGDKLLKFAHLIAEDCAKRCEALRPCGRGDCDDLAAAIREAYKP